MAKNELQKIAADVVTKGNSGLRKKLAKEKFDPVRQLLRNVYPQLDPKDQARVCLELAGYLYPKHKAQESTTRRRSRPPQQNLQVNIHGVEPDSVDLVSLASQKLPGE